MLTFRNHSIAAVAAFFAAFLCVANATSINLSTPSHHGAVASI